MRTLRFNMSGTDVMEVQATLQKLGYYGGEPDGIFGPQTLRSVRAFQADFGLVPDGVIGPRTWQALQRFLLGYDTYTIKRGDTLYGISMVYGTTPALILAANPGIMADSLRIGQMITVPYGFPVVDTNIDYTYDIMERDIDGLKARYPFLEVGSAGQSSLGRSLYYIRLGNGPNRVFYNGAHHSLEWITVPVLMKFIEDFSSAYAQGMMIGGYNPSEIWEASSIYIVPMVNPDGVDLVLNGLSPDNPNYSLLIRWNNGSSDFSRTWQANNNGVDLNHNYNAGWEESRQAAAAAGITGPGPTRYSGPYPESEPEVQSIVSFTRGHDFGLVLAYHSQGEVIYWNFQNLAPPEALTIGRALANVSGYALSEAVGIASYAGYKDWFTQEFRRPGYTVEVGIGTNPLPISQFDSVYSDNLPLLLLASIIRA